MELEERLREGLISYEEYRQAVDLQRLTEDMRQWAESMAEACRNLVESMKPVLEQLAKLTAEIRRHSAALNHDGLISTRGWEPVYTIRYNDELRNVSLN